MIPTRRRFMAGTAALAVPTAALAQRKGGSITVAALGGVFQQQFQTALIDSFRRVRPDIAVYYYPVSNPGQIVGLLRQGAQPSAFDVALLNPRSARLATAQGLVTPLEPDTIPTVNEIVPAARLDGIAGVVAMVDSLGMPYVPEAERAEMTSWRLLWDPAIARRITIPAAPDPIGVGITVIASRLFSQGQGRDAIVDGINALSHVIKRVVNLNPKPDVYDFLIDGKAEFGVAWNSIGQVRAQRNPTRLRMALPREFPVREMHTIHLVANTARPEAARAFINYVLGAEGQSRMAEALFMTPMHPGARVSAETTRRILPLENRNGPIVGVDSPEIEDLRGAIMTGWREELMRAR